MAAHRKGRAKTDDEADELAMGCACHVDPGWDMKQFTSYIILVQQVHHGRQPLLWLSNVCVCGVDAHVPASDLRKPMSLLIYLKSAPGRACMFILSISFVTHRVLFTPIHTVLARYPWPSFCRGIMHAPVRQEATGTYLDPSRDAKQLSNSCGWQCKSDI